MHIEEEFFGEMYHSHPYDPNDIDQFLNINRDREMRENSRDNRMGRWDYEEHCIFLEALATTTTQK